MLQPHPHRAPHPGPVVVVVLDGIGLGREDEGDAVALARTPCLDLLRQGPTVQLRAHGRAVGLPSDEDMGNSEVGHNTLGAGRVFEQGASLVDRAIEDGSFWQSTAWADVTAGPSRGAALHFIGLLSDGNVHSHQRHLDAMLEAAARAGARRVFVHVLLDGRDVPEGTGLHYVARLEEVLTRLEGTWGGRFRIASGGGRMFVTMDRYEADWSIVERGWRAHVLGDGASFPSVSEAISSLRGKQDKPSDQHLPPFVIAEDGQAIGPIVDGDSVVLWNFRGDRAVQITRAFTQSDFRAFDRQRHPSVTFAGMMMYDGDLRLPERFLVAPPRIEGALSQCLASQGLRQLACAETQKFGHVTYFWNGNRSAAWPGERWTEVPSDRRPFEERPWMKAAEVTDAVVDALAAPEKPHFVRVNYANGDMVGHTGRLDATILAVEAVDLSLARLLDAVAACGGVALVTADHGNAEQMFQIDKKSGRYTPVPMTSHSLNAVPLHLFDPHGGRTLVARPDAGLAHVAGTALELLGFAVPDSWCPSLLAGP